MEIINAIILGIIQGLTEFLPVSSSGHLEIAKAILFILNSQSITGHLIPIDSGQHLGWAQGNNKKILNE